MNSRAKFSLFSNCIPVDGPRRSIICDLQLNKYNFVPNDLFDLFKNNGTIEIESLAQTYGNENAEVIKDYINFLVDNNYGFYNYQEEKDNFPGLDLSFSIPSQISNAIIDFNAVKFGPDYLKSIGFKIAELDELGCRAVLLRFFGNFNIQQMSEILSMMDNTGIESVQIIVKYSIELSITENINTFLQKYLRIFDLVIFSSPKKGRLVDNIKKYAITYLENDIIDETHCGQITQTAFAVNLALFSESQCFNNCLNKKIGIDSNGNIKNCPTMRTSYGKIKDKKLVDVIDEFSFKEVWSVTKADIEECKVCEFRYICTDCRAFLSEDQISYKKPKKCNYDPFQAEWK